MQSISVVVPVYNEEESVKECYLEISKVLESMGRSYEIIFVNDGSKDNTLEVLKECAKRDSHLVVIEFRRNGKLMHDGFPFGKNFNVKKIRACVDMCDCGDEVMFLPS